MTKQMEVKETLKEKLARLKAEAAEKRRQRELDGLIIKKPEVYPDPFDVFGEYTPEEEAQAKLESKARIAAKRAAREELEKKQQEELEAKRLRLLAIRKAEREAYLAELAKEDERRKKEEEKRKEVSARIRAKLQAMRDEAYRKSEERRMKLFD